MATQGFDASELTAFGQKILAAQYATSKKIAATVKRAAQNVKDNVQKDVAGSSNSGLRKIRVGYELGSSGTRIYADVSPRDEGASELANIAFFGTAKGGGTHEFYEHAERELPNLAQYVSNAADETWKEIL